jgi:RND family efflux transporter MFP subunit
MSLLAFAVCVVLAGCAALVSPAMAQQPVAIGGSEENSVNKGPAVTVVEARRTIFVDNVVVTGSLVPREEILIGPEIDGYRITELLADEGDVVKPGQALARLAKETLTAQLAQNTASVAKAQAAIEQAESNIAEAEASLVQAREAFDRIKPLRQSGAASQATFEEREALFRTAQARLSAARNALGVARADKDVIEAQRRELELRLGFTDIETPVGGLVTRRNARIGAVSSSQADALFRIIRDGQVELSAEVPEFHLSKLQSGQKADVTVSGAEPRVGTVRLVSPEVDVATRLGKVRIFLGDEPDLRIGMFARARIKSTEREAIGVPMTAVLYSDDRATVLVVEDNRVRERVVTTGLVSGDQIEIASGLKAGELVIRRAGALLRDGEAVTPVLAEKAVSEVR